MLKTPFRLRFVSDNWHLPGTYSLGNTSSCTTCPAGKNCSDPTVAPSACDAGYYSPYGVPHCSKCDPGMCALFSQCLCFKFILIGEITSNYPQINTCPSFTGTYSVGDVASCTTCGSGKNCSDQTVTPPDCDAGYYSSAGDPQCSFCLAGTAQWMHCWVCLDWWILLGYGLKSIVSHCCVCHI